MTPVNRNASGVDLDRRAIELVRDQVFPAWWTLVPTKGKDTYETGWPDLEKTLTREFAVSRYRTNSGYNGFGVVTGEKSGGLLALDIDGPSADARYKEVAGDAYRPAGDEDTMATTSGREGRRQILYRVPNSVLRELRKVNKLILRTDGEWHQGGGDSNAKKDAPEEKYEELVIRFNRCQTVLPGSIHPVTKKRYSFLQFNNGEVAKAPAWIMDALLRFAKPHQFLSDQDLKYLDEDVSGTQLPERQIRGWFFKEDVQKLLRPRFEELVFKHPELDGNWKEKGDGVHRMNYCPWHGGESGTSLQVDWKEGTWYCFADGEGGDVIDFIHRLNVNDITADRPHGADLEAIVAELAQGIGLNYP